MPSMKVEITGFSEILKKLTDLEGNVRKVTEKALEESYEIVTKKAEAAMAPSYLPAKGKYSTGQTLGALKRDQAVMWQGDTAYIRVGFDLREGGLVSLFLMYGTPRMAPDKALYNAFYSAKTKKEVTEAQENVFFDAIRRLEE